MQAGGGAHDELGTFQDAHPRRLGVQHGTRTQQQAGVLATQLPQHMHGRGHGHGDLQRVHAAGDDGRGHVQCLLRRVGAQHPDNAAPFQ